eukprot:TRINITY_DN1292_c0_g1_i1.p1 TRINITY_DN1292_c0_g1~~TRINITY_DN1292_c0_g1_i1.p1  ORF type:complete len:247 (+),score=34.64 TRINITY_DN1292_c0_g1_i1:80-742(+)
MQLLALGCEDKRVVFYSVPQFEEIGRTKTDKPVISVHFHPRKPLLLAGMKEGEIGVLPINSTKRPPSLNAASEKHKVHDSWVRSIRFSRDASLLLTSGDDGSVRISEADTYRVLRKHSSGSTGYGNIFAARFFKNDSMVIASTQASVLVADTLTALNHPGPSENFRGIDVIDRRPWDEISDLRTLCVVQAVARLARTGDAVVKRSLSKLPQHLRDELERS